MSQAVDIYENIAKHALLSHLLQKAFSHA